MTHPTQADAMAALDLYLEKASGHSCKQCPAPTDDELSSAIRAVVTIRAYIEQNSPATSDAAIGSGTNAVLRLQDGQESAPDRGDIIIINREDVPEGLEEALSGNDIYNAKHNNAIYQAAALVAKAKAKGE